MTVLGAVSTSGGSSGVTPVVDGTKSTDLTKQTEQQHAVLKRSFNPFYGSGGSEWSGFAAPNAFQQWNK